MKTWIDQLQQRNAERAAHVTQTEADKVAQFRERMSPVVERLARFIASIPESERVPRSLDFYVRALRPRWSGKHAAARDVADALRHLGFKRVRAWNTPEQGFRTLWYWPENPDTR
jgi:hypothetical protein